MLTGPSYAESTHSGSVVVVVIVVVDTVVVDTVVIVNDVRVELVLSHSSQSAGHDPGDMNGHRFSVLSSHDGGSISPLQARLVVVAVLVSDVVPVDVAVVVEHALHFSGHRARTMALKFTWSQYSSNKSSHSSGSTFWLHFNIVVVDMVVEDMDVVVSGHAPQSAGHVRFTSPPTIGRPQSAAE